MSRSRSDLGKRIAELRRRHFGARGKARFAEQLGLPLDEYERYERGTMPPGDLMLRICELTGEDLQWLLTGVSARGTVVISGARGRHQDLIARLAAALDANPKLAAPVEAFLDLLLTSDQQRAAQPTLPGPDERTWIPIYRTDQSPLALPRADETRGDGGLVAQRRTDAIVAQSPWQLSEPSMDPAAAADAPSLQLVQVADAEGPVEFIESQSIAAALPGIFGVRLDNDAMRPMFADGDVALVVGNLPPQAGRPALCRLKTPSSVCCRIWLGEEGDDIVLGRLDDQNTERIASGDVAWALEVIYRLSPAA